MPARAEYAAAEADVFPVEAHIVAFMPFSQAFDMAIVMPLSLNDPVGFNPSYFTYISTLGAIIFSILFILIKGVFPSFKEITGVFLVTGRYFLYFSMRPLYCFINSPKKSDYLNLRRENRHKIF